jgi:hypothetical protein
MAVLAVISRSHWLPLQLEEQFGALLVEQYLASLEQATILLPIWAT